MLFDIIKDEIDNLIYALLGMILVFIVMWLDKGTGITMASALGGAFLIKIRGGTGDGKTKFFQTTDGGDEPGQ